MDSSICRTHLTGQNKLCWGKCNCIQIESKLYAFGSVPTLPSKLSFFLVLSCFCVAFFHVNGSYVKHGGWWRVKTTVSLSTYPCLSIVASLLAFLVRRAIHCCSSLYVYLKLSYVCIPLQAMENQLYMKQMICELTDRTMALSTWFVIVAEALLHI